MEVCKVVETISQHYMLQSFQIKIQKWYFPVLTAEIFCVLGCICMIVLMYLTSNRLCLKSFYHNHLFIFRKQRSLVVSTGSPKRCSPKIPTVDFGKIVLCKRIFSPVKDIPGHQVEQHLLYSQALHYNVLVCYD